jgi:hypothetical protein
MNERIKELAKQAGGHKCLCVDAMSISLLGENSIEKFAELIVQECASQVRFTDLLKCNDDSDGEILLQASVQLKQHFGVEE